LATEAWTDRQSMHQLKAAKKAGDLWLICDGERREGRDLGAAAVGGLGLGAARPPVARMKTRAGSITSLIGGPTHRAPLGRDPWPQSAEQRAWRRGPSERPSMHMRLMHALPFWTLVVLWAFGGWSGLPNWAIWPGHRPIVYIGPP
jgi:hypothetical protein